VVEVKDDPTDTTPPLLLGDRNREERLEHRPQLVERGHSRTAMEITSLFLQVSYKRRGSEISKQAFAPLY
jgi:hypothetical protein